MIERPIAPPPSPSLKAEQAPAKMNGHRAGIHLANLIGQPLVEGKIICPFHADQRPSLHIYDDHYHCFACGAHGDRIDWLMMVQSKTRDQAERIIAYWNGVTVASRPKTADDDARTLALALRLWKEAKPIAGTLAVKYLGDVRKINLNILPADAPLRFHPNCPFDSGVRYPCLIALYRDVVTDEPAGIHRIALVPGVFAGAKVQRKSLGSWPTPRAI